MVIEKLPDGLRAQEFGGEALGADDLAGQLRVVHRLRVVQAAVDEHVIEGADEGEDGEEGNNAGEDLALAHFHGLYRRLKEIHFGLIW